MIDLQETSRNSPSSFFSVLTASSLQSLRDSSTFSTVEYWLESLEEIPDHDPDDTFENISDEYDTPYKENVNNASSFTQTQFMCQTLPLNRLKMVVIFFLNQKIVKT